MKKLSRCLISILLGVVVLGIPLCVKADGVFVYDTAHVLSATTVKKMDKNLQSVASGSGANIRLVTYIRDSKESDSDFELNTSKRYMTSQNDIVCILTVNGSQFSYAVGSNYAKCFNDDSFKKLSNISSKYLSKGDYNDAMLVVEKQVSKDILSYNNEDNNDSIVIIYFEVLCTFMLLLVSAAYCFVRMSRITYSKSKVNDKQEGN